ncbi:hypothetical protein DYB30_001534 [Aphanomyces astaci]|uniref:ABC1 atypical kinase-like domain-containing protein n=1 Tax=Aphanomyces astaci TaxID=112090 RepID=A0A397DBD9_APHAT|nr:hypothetical protein DYB30_001534 [Aphanomyces astaci]
MSRCNRCDEFVMLPIEIVANIVECLTHMEIHHLEAAHPRFRMQVEGYNCWKQDVVWRIVLDKTQWFRTASATMTHFSNNHRAMSVWKRLGCLAHLAGSSKYGQDTLIADELSSFSMFRLLTRRQASLGETIQMLCGCSSGNSCYWSSAASTTQNAEESIYYRMRGHCVVRAVSVLPYRVFWHPNAPTYGPQQVSFSFYANERNVDSEHEVPFYVSPVFDVVNDMVVRAETFVDFKRNVPVKPDDDTEDANDFTRTLLRNEYKAALREYNLRTAERLLHVCKQNGGVFTKIGQQLASLNHALPVEYTSTLSVLQDRALPVSFEEAKAAVERELGGPLDKFFREFNTKPIAAASLAQVHHAITQDGNEVAVKIQYPQLAKTLASDLWTVRQAIYAVERIWDINIRWIIPEIEQALEAEVYDELSTTRVLTMEFIHGVKVTDLDSITQTLGLDPVDIAGKVSAMFAEMVFCSGFVHCDPHPGNLFVRRHPHRPSEVPCAQVVLLDHGLYRQLDDDFRRTFCRLWKALLLRDNKLLLECGDRFHVGPYAKFFPLIFTYRSMDSKTIMGGQMSADEKLALRRDLKALQGTNVNEFFEHLPRDMLFVFRSTNLTRSLNKELGGNSR